MDIFEKRILLYTGVLLVIFLVALIHSVKSGVNDVPECVPYGEAYTQPRIVKLDDSTYQVYMTAQMWSFEPTEIYLPVGAEVDFYLTTKDVVHGLAILNKNVNMMAVYGGINKTTVRFDEPGVYPVVCHEYCGAGHQNMMSEVIVNYPNQ